MNEEESDLKLTCTEIGEVNVVQITGNIDLYTTPELKEVFDRFNAKDSYKILIDLSKDNTVFLNCLSLPYAISIRKIILLQ